jgi:uncharacterized Ntn-hydrolase superfamily protein
VKRFWDDREVTFSIVAADMSGRDGPEWGVAVASKFLAAGSVVPWARAGAGAVATQALANVSYGPEGLEWLGEGMGAEEVVHELTSADREAAHRQLGIVDASGRPATFTGAECLEWAGGVTGPGFCCQGNILVGPGVVEAMAKAFENSDRDFAEALIDALAAGFEAGGDRRGMQSAALLVVREGGGYGGLSDRAIDLRIDDHPDAVDELKRVLSLHRLYFPSAGSLEFLPIDDRLATELRGRLRALGFPVEDRTGYDDSVRSALSAWAGIENLEERWTDEARIEKTVLDHLRNSSR